MGFLTANQDHVRRVLQDRLGYVKQAADINHESLEQRRKDIAELEKQANRLYEEEQQLEAALESMTPRCITCKQPLAE